MELRTDINHILKTSFILSTLSSGLFFMIWGLTNPSITASIIGAQASSRSIILGAALFVVAVAFTFHWDNGYKRELEQR